MGLFPLIGVFADRPIGVDAPIMGHRSTGSAGSRQIHMRDFSTGSIWRHLLAFSWPMFVGNLLQALYSTVDSFWVGRYVGPEALGAVSISFPVTFILMSMILGLTMATTTLVAQYRGAEDHQRVRKT